MFVWTLEKWCDIKQHQLMWWGGHRCVVGFVGLGAQFFLCGELAGSIKLITQPSDLSHAHALFCHVFGVCWFTGVCDYWMEERYGWVSAQKFLPHSWHTGGLLLKHHNWHLFSENRTSAGLCVQWQTDDLSYGFINIVWCAEPERDVWISITSHTPRSRFFTVRSV